MIPDRLDPLMAKFDYELIAFVSESNHIEGIDRVPTELELESTRAFLRSRELKVDIIEALVQVYAPGKHLRDGPTMNVRVGEHVPPRGGPMIRHQLAILLDRINKREVNAYDAHQEYEQLHPFMDGNGRSGRAIWLWMMQGRAPLGFLHTWYYQSLQAGR